jgi:23S rRNA pseudouridine1911/1915/1917 synthase
LHREIRIDAANAGRRLDAFLRQLLPELPRGTLMKWIRKGVVRVNGKKGKGETRLAEGDLLGLPDVHAQPGVRRELPKPVVVYEDEDLLIADKPAGLASHAGTGHEEDSLEARIVAYLGAHDAAPGHRPGLAQRLDADVSGLLPVGKHAVALRALAAADKAKTYVALVEGRMREESGTIDLALEVGDEPARDRPRTKPVAAGQRAVTHWRVVERFAAATLIEVTIETGRTHQIRAHLAAVEHPIMGDPRYGRPTRELARPFLHAARLSLPHPRDGRTIAVESPLPEDLARLLARQR